MDVVHKELTSAGVC